MSVPSGVPAEAALPAAVPVPGAGGQPVPLLAGHPQPAEQPDETAAPGIPRLYSMVELVTTGIPILLFLFSAMAGLGFTCGRDERRSSKPAACLAVAK